MALAMLALLWPRLVTAQDKPLELAVKAAFIPKFLPFVEWPAGAFPTAGAALRICVIGGDPFGDLLDRAAGNQTVAGHPLAVQRLPVATRGDDCQVVYAAGSPEQSVATILATVRGLPVLTVTNEATDARSRGIINLIVDASRVRFEIDQAAAAQSGLSISSKLLNLAARVLNGR